MLAADHDAFEVLVVDRSERPRLLQTDDRLRCISTERVGKSAALNIGITKSRAPLVLFTDDDCTVPADWLTRAETVMADHPHVAMAFGDLVPIAHDPAGHFIPAAHLGSYRELRGKRFAHVRGGAGANMIARRELFDTVGGWDEMIGPSSRFKACEEWDLYYRTLAASQTVARAPELSVTHWGSRAYDDGAGQALLRGYAYGEGAVIGKHLRLLDPGMLLTALRILIEDLAAIARNLRRRRLTGLGSLAHKARGLLAGLTSPVDRRRHVFVDSARVATPPPWRRVRFTLASLGWRRGLLETATHRWPYEPAKDRSFDDRHGTSTGGSVETDHLGIADTATRDAAILYLPSPESVTNWMLDRVDVVPRDTTFVDLGCGKGRVLLIAAQRPFRRVIGVEISPELAAIAEQNRLEYRPPPSLRADVEIANDDVTTFDMPPGDLLLHLYHPFQPEITAKVLERLERSLADPPRRVVLAYLAYTHAVEPVTAMLADFPWLGPVRYEQSVRGHYNWLIASN